METKRTTHEIIALISRGHKETIKEIEKQMENENGLI